MSEVPRILAAIGRPEPESPSRLLPLIYDELRKLAARRLAGEPAGQTLQATALVHEAYLRLVGEGSPQGWAGRAHFFAAAATAMRRILIDRARRKRRAVHGGGHVRRELHPDLVATAGADEDLLALDEALTRLAGRDPVKARLVELRYFAGLTGEQAAEALGISPRTVDRHWTFARAWLRREMERGEAGRSALPGKIRDAGDALSAH